MADSTTFPEEYVTGRPIAHIHPPNTISTVQFTEQNICTTIYTGSQTIYTMMATGLKNASATQGVEAAANELLKWTDTVREIIANLPTYSTGMAGERDHIVSIVDSMFAKYTTPNAPDYEYPTSTSDEKYAMLDTRYPATGSSDYTYEPNPEFPIENSYVNTVLNSRTGRYHGGTEDISNEEAIYNVLDEINAHYFGDGSTETHDSYTVQITRAQLGALFDQMDEKIDNEYRGIVRNFKETYKSKAFIKETYDEAIAGTLETPQGNPYTIAPIFYPPETLNEVYSWTENTVIESSLDSDSTFISKAFGEMSNIKTQMEQGEITEDDGMIQLADKFMELLANLSTLNTSIESKLTTSLNPLKERVTQINSQIDDGTFTMPESTSDTTYTDVITNYQIDDEFYHYIEQAYANDPQAFVDKLTSDINSYIVNNQYFVETFLGPLNEYYHHPISTKTNSNYSIALTVDQVKGIALESLTNLETPLRNLVSEFNTIFTTKNEVVRKFDEHIANLNTIPDDPGPTIVVPEDPDPGETGDDDVAIEDNADVFTGYTDPDPVGQSDIYPKEIKMENVATTDPKYTQYVSEFNAAINAFIKRCPWAVKYQTHGDETIITLFFGAERDVVLKQISKLCRTTHNDDSFKILTGSTGGATELPCKIVDATDVMIKFVGKTAEVEPAIAAGGAQMDVLKVKSDQIYSYNAQTIATNIKDKIVAKLVTKKSGLLDSTLEHSGIVIRGAGATGTVTVEMDKLIRYLGKLEEAGVHNASDNQLVQKANYDILKEVLTVCKELDDVRHNDPDVVGEIASELEKNKLGFVRLYERGVTITYDIDTHAENPRDTTPSGTNGRYSEDIDGNVVDGGYSGHEDVKDTGSSVPEESGGDDENQEPAADGDAQGDSDPVAGGDDATQDPAASGDDDTQDPDAQGTA